MNNNDDLLLHDENDNNENNNNNNNEQPNKKVNKQAEAQKQNVNNEINEINELPDNMQNANDINNQPNDEQAEADKKKKKQEDLLLNSQPDNALLKNEEKKPEVQEESIINKKLAEVSNGSGIKLKAYFVEENSKEINDISKGKLGYTNFKFNGNMKDFYSKVYKHVLESNLIARQLTDGKDRENLPTFKELSVKFEEFMKDLGEELVQRGHLDKYVPFGGLSAAEIKAIENSCLLNRPKNEKEAIERNVSNVQGKNFDEIVSNGYQKASDTISNLYGEDYKKGDPEKDKNFLQTSANLIKGMSMLRNSEKIWNTYTPDLSAPKWNQPIYKNIFSNAFKAVGRGLSIAFDGLVKFPVINASRAIKYPFEKVAQVISTKYNQAQLEKLVYAKGFSKNELNAYINKSEKSALNVENDVKAVEENYKNNGQTIKDYKLEQNKKELPVKEEKNVNVEEVKKEDEHIKKIEVPEASDDFEQQEIVPMIDDKSKVLEKDNIINKG